MLMKMTVSFAGRAVAGIFKKANQLAYKQRPLEPRIDRSVSVRKP